MEDHYAEWTTKELKDLQMEQQQMAAGGSLRRTGEGRVTPTSLVKKMLGKWGKMQSFIEKYHHDKKVAIKLVQ